MDKFMKETENGFLLSKEFFIEKLNVDVDLSTENDWLDSFSVSEIAVELSYKQADRMDFILHLLNIAESMRPNFNKPFINHSFRLVVMKNFLDSRPTEFDIHELFKNNYRNYLGNELKIVKRKNNPKHIPDFWLEHDNDFIPVEIKLYEFNSTHLKQLQRYMDFYKCEIGMAVAKELKCPLPNNIQFINYEHLQEA